MADENNTTAQDAVPSPIQPDLDQLRDDRVIPVARETLKIMAGQTGTDDKDSYVAALTDILRVSLAADLNLTMENPYIFQLTLGVYAAFQNVAQQVPMAESQDPRYAKIGREMMGLLVSANVPMGMNVKQEEQEKALEGIKPQLEALYLRENLSNLEVGHILEGIFRAFKTMEQGFSGNVERSVKRLEMKILQLQDMDDLTMSRLNEVLTTDIEELLAAGRVTRATGSEVE